MRNHENQTTTGVRSGIRARTRGAALVLVSLAALGSAGLTVSTATPASADGPCPDAGTVTMGTDGNDVLVGTSGRDTIVGRGGNDVIIGKGGDDSLYGGDGNDLVIGGLDEDCVSGGSGNDWVSGDDWQSQSGTDPDEIDGNGGSDEVWNYELGESGGSAERVRY